MLRCQHTNIERKHSGSVILYSGSSQPYREASRFQQSHWTQVSLLVYLPKIPQPLVFESTKFASSHDVYLDRIISGVQLTLLTEKIQHFKGDIAIRRLMCPLNSRQEANLHEAIDVLHGLPYNNSPYSMARGLRRRNFQRTAESFYCSELVAETYQRIGLLPLPPDGPICSNYAPKDFAGETSFIPPLINNGLEEMRLLLRH